MRMAQTVLAWQRNCDLRRSSNGCLPALAYALGRYKVLGQHVRLFPSRQGIQFFEVAKKLLGYLGKVGFVAHAVGIGNGNPPFIAQMLNLDSGKSGLQS